MLSPVIHFSFVQQPSRERPRATSATHGNLQTHNQLLMSVNTVDVETTHTYTCHSHLSCLLSIPPCMFIQPSCVHRCVSVSVRWPVPDGSFMPWEETPVWWQWPQQSLLIGWVRLITLWSCRWVLYWLLNPFHSFFFSCCFDEYLIFVFYLCPVTIIRNY